MREGYKYFLKIYMAGGIEGAGNDEGENTTPKNIMDFSEKEQRLMEAILKGREIRADMVEKEAADRAGENADAELGKLESGDLKGEYIPELDTGDLDDVKAMMLANKIQSGEVALGELTPDDKSKINIFIKNNPNSISSKGLAIAINKLSS